MALSNNAEMNRLVSRPFIIYSGTDLTGTATGDAEVRNYCALPYTSASRYQLDRPDHNNIFQFQRTINGVTEDVYKRQSLHLPTSSSMVLSPTGWSSRG